MSGSEAKACTGCKAQKPLVDFGRNKACRDGRKSRCRQCERDWAAEFRRAHPERVRTTLQRYASNHLPRIREKNRRWRNSNKDAARKAVVRATAWAQANPDKAKANRARHRAAKLRATPLWADHAAIRAIYRAATLLGPGFHVDHIVPLQGETVCGLHCEANLQIIPAGVNIAKHNRHWPHMFDGAAL